MTEESITEENIVMLRYLYLYWIKGQQAIIIPYKTDEFSYLIDSGLVKRRLAYNPHTEQTCYVVELTPAGILYAHAIGDGST